MEAVRDLWLRWKMLRLPWRKKFLIGQDLQGNTFWEFKDTLNPGRWRRIVNTNRRTHFSDVQISPQWHQWLRQTRADAPSLQEQAADIQRQTLLKHNAQLADKRWAEKPRYIETPNSAATIPLRAAPEIDRASAEFMPGQPPQLQKTRTAAETAVHPPEADSLKNTQETGANPGANWQPQPWLPGSAKR
ncbi:hypothetical protein A1O3_09012 [Capronia epimyces CBS 606.96]|uniref:Uncharacterized protein n=1 Tax=Capronia epimyces CBS 606.96 TaxID=1182542 RepID=W9XCC7_9EURO|nr:uncharacterized protein A1O3_09012 [Capronia epimyces CBS 606.96]EXJ77853.1 hypothetical protein A1O3_09012 [Capronia epimyces CBS 606.96]